MYRAPLARSLAAIFTILIFVSVSLAPAIASQMPPNSCLVADKECDGPHAQAQSYCTCPVPGGRFIIHGKCVKPEVCQYVSWSQVNGTTVFTSLEGAPSSVTGALNNFQADTSIFGDIGKFIKDNPLISGIGLGAGMSLLQSLMSPSGGSYPSTGGNSPYSTGFCTTQYYDTSNANALSDPCARYNPSTNTTCPTITTPLCLNGRLEAQPNDANNCPVASQCVPNTCPPFITSACLSGTLVEQPKDSNNCPVAPVCKTNTSTDGYTLSISPLTGAPPLLVTAKFFSGTACDDAYDLSWGDGSPDVTMTYTPPSFGSACALVALGHNLTHTYATAGTYTATLLSGASLQFTSTVTVTVGNVNSPTITTTDIGTNTPVPVSDLLNNTQYYTNTTNPSTPNASQTPLNQKNPPVPVNGLHGDLLSFGGGATIYAASRSGNVEVSGFYGRSGTSAPQSIAGGLCKSRPWSNNFLSNIIPPAFFDNLCTWSGYQVGAVQSSGAGVQYGGSSSNRVSVPAPRTTQPYSNPVVAQAKIWARPASVSLGGRTTIFWTSQNVSTCTESSSDGNFSGNSTSGGASTVPLSGATRFTIQCQTRDGQTVSDSTTVNIGI